MKLMEGCEMDFPRSAMEMQRQFKSRVRLNPTQQKTRCFLRAEVFGWISCHITLVASLSGLSFVVCGRVLLEHPSDLNHILFNRNKACPPP